MFTYIHPPPFFLWAASLVAQLVMNPPAMQETWVRSLGWEDPLEKEMAPAPVFMPGESHGQRSLEGYSPQGCKSQTQFSNYTTTTISFLGFASYLDHTEH